MGSSSLGRPIYKVECYGRRFTYASCSLETYSYYSEESGHLSQSKGFVEALRKEIDIKVDIVVGKTTLRGFLRPFFRYFLELRFRCTDSTLLRITNFRTPVRSIENPI